MRQRLNRARQAHDIAGMHDVHGICAVSQHAHGCRPIARRRAPPTPRPARHRRRRPVRTAQLACAADTCSTNTRRALLWAKRRHQHRQERVGVDAEFGADRLAVAHRRIVGDAACDHTDRVGAVAVAHQLLRLTQSHGDDRVRPRSHRPQQELLVPAERSHPERVVAQVLGDYVGCALSPRKHVADEVAH